MTAVRVGVKPRQPLCLDPIKHPVIQLWQVSQDNATQRAKQIRLAHHKAPIAHYALGNHKTNDRWARRGNTFAFLTYSHLHYLHLSCEAWQPNISVSVWFPCYVCTPQNKGKLHSRISVYGAPHRFCCCQWSHAAAVKNSPGPSPRVCFLVAVHLCTSWFCFNCVLFLLFCRWIFFLRLRSRWFSIKLWTCTFPTRPHTDWSGLIGVDLAQKHSRQTWLIWKCIWKCNYVSGSYQCWCNKVAESVNRPLKPSAEPVIWTQQTLERKIKLCRGARGLRKRRLQGQLAFTYFFQ